MAGIFSRPVFASPERTERASNFFYTAWTILAALTVVLAGSYIAQPYLARAIGSVLLADMAVTLLALEFNRRGYVALTAWVYILVLVAIAIGRAPFPAASMPRRCTAFISSRW